MLVLSFRSPIDRSASELSAWHQRRGAFERLVPPWNAPEVIEPLESLRPGARSRLRLAVGPVHREMLVEISRVEALGFTDVQIEGPFEQWTHNHRFLERGRAQSELHDEIHCQPPLGSFGHLSEAYARQQVETVFAWRHRITREDLARRDALGDGQPLHILLIGGTGQIGQAFQHLATTQGHRVSVLTRNPRAAHHHHWNPARGELKLSSLEPADAVVHLAGANVAQDRWSDERKRIILESRTKSTQLLARALANLPPKQRPRVLVCASGISGLKADGLPQDESAPLNCSTFLGEVVARWEESANPARQAGIRTVHARLAPVLDPRGGVIAKLLPIFRTGLGGPVGNPSANFPWIAQEDVIELLLRACLDERYSGPVHFCAPRTPSRRQFSAALGRALSRPAITPTPAFAVRLAMGRQLANETALADIHPIPAVLEKLAYPFRFPDIGDALSAQLGQARMNGQADGDEIV